jgi:hypothetical protein
MCATESVAQPLRLPCSLIHIHSTHNALHKATQPSTRSVRHHVHKNPPVDHLWRSRWEGSHLSTSSSNLKDRAMPRLRQWVAGLSPRRPGFVPRSVHVGFVVDKVELEQVFLQVLWFSYITWEMNNRTVGGCSSETQSHPIDMNNNLKDHPSSATRNCSLPCAKLMTASCFHDKRKNPEANFVFVSFHTMRFVAWTATSTLNIHTHWETKLFSVYF